MRNLFIPQEDRKWCLCETLQQELAKFKCWPLKTHIMRWEDLKVYRPLSKEELKPAFKDFTKITADSLKPFGFSLHGRKLIALSNDLLQIIHLDTRGSWAGVNEYFKTEISIVAVSDKSPFIRGFELTGIKKIEDIVIGIRDSYRITQEYHLLADFMTRKIIEHVLPYFDKFNNSKKILDDRRSFKIGDVSQGNDNLILFCELQNKMNIEAGKMIDKNLAFYSSLNPDRSKLKEYFEELELYKSGLQANDWSAIDQKLEANKIQVFKKLKINPASNISFLQ